MKPIWPMMASPKSDLSEEKEKGKKMNVETLASSLPVPPTEAEEKCDELSRRIRALCTFEDIGSLKDEMKELQKALLENPAACSLLLEEDIGLAVQALQRTLSAAVIEANAPKAKGRKAGSTNKNKPMSADELRKAIEELKEEDDDFEED